MTPERVCGDHGVPEGATDNRCPTCGESVTSTSDPEREHGDWDKTQQRYEDGCKHDAPPHDPERVTLTDEQMAQIRSWSPSIAAAVSDRLREAKADAWDEGYMRCYDDRNYEPGYGQSNPYREASHEH